jgi:hypothetical protein
MPKFLSFRDVLSVPLVYDDGEELDRRVLMNCRNQQRYWDKVRELLLRNPDVDLPEIHRQANGDIGNH